MYWFTTENILNTKLYFHKNKNNRKKERKPTVILSEYIQRKSPRYRNGSTIQNRIEDFPYLLHVNKKKKKQKEPLNRRRRYQMEYQYMNRKKNHQ